MQGNTLYFVIVPLVLIIIDYYILRGIQTAFIKRQFTRKKWFLSLYWFGSLFLITILLLSIYSKMSVGARGAFLFLFFITFLFKIFYVLFIAVDDLRRFIIYLIHKNKTAPDPEKDNGFKSIPRSEFLMKAGILAGAVPLYLIKHNMSKGLYDYHVINVDLYLPNLPKAFDGMRIGQISDIHSGSFHSVHNMQGGVQMLLNQKTDVIFFTGDLVNGQTSEVNRVIDVFKK